MFRDTTLSVIAIAAAFVAFQPIANANAEGVYQINPEILAVEPAITPELVATPTLAEPDYTIIPSDPIVLDPISCKAARKLVKNAGYHKIKTIECNGAVYTFKAKKNGHKMAVAVNAYSKQVSAL